MKNNGGSNGYATTSGLYKKANFADPTICMNNAANSCSSLRHLNAFHVNPVMKCTPSRDRESLRPNRRDLPV